MTVGDEDQDSLSLGLSGVTYANSIRVTIPSDAGKVP